jgi:hypothetical protein
MGDPVQQRAVVYFVTASSSAALPRPAARDAFDFLLFPPIPPRCAGRFPL